jgi:dihydropteroate synthase
MHKNNTSFQIAHNHGVLNFSTPLVMGIVNVTPDSFFDGNTHNGITKAIDHCIQLINQGADIIDIGGQSTRPNATLLSAQQELDRIATVIEAVRNFNPSICISIDTFYSEVAKQSIAFGADIINDVSAGNMDEAMLATIGKLQVPYMMMHMQGTPSTMQLNPHYDDVTKDVYTYLQNKINDCKQHQIQQIIIDPGFGFGKTIQHNYQLLNKLNEFTKLDCPILVGLSRKSMVYKALQLDAQQALNGTTALHMAALLHGANILRVHDVVEAKQVVLLYAQMQAEDN